MKIYTKRGDKGLTSLFGGERVSKSHIRIEAYGLMDELGVQLAKLCNCSVLNESELGLLRDIQNELFTCGSYLAKAFSKDQFELKSNSGLTWKIEENIDSMADILPALQSFILPGGHADAIQAHVCRVSTRNVERVISKLNQDTELSDRLLQFLNRLSDYFFTLARYINIKYDIEEVLWQP